ncbi:uncharacterized protein J4E87_007589 [Alternaria ethzedia]|uniref:uncharacterized protein n=1 Tax=Alternaria ethzedia TaxID=181014 RepID=UPI0020C2AAE4|nr:uncharacterized protein J4E87_007589 [Alternaria ethzedia]KAI4619339.1 hypothetical protein J4E87_007589 [Alternaria ethzedia]
MSRLEALPQHIRRDILRYLLLSDRVRGPPNRHLIEDYDFQVAVLRTSKAINQEAAKVFYGDNKWIKLHNGYGTTIENALLNHEVPYFKLGTKKFDNHVAEVKVDPNYQRKATGKYGGKTTVGVLLLQDMPKLARALRILDFANHMGYDFKFALHKPPGTVSTLGREDQERFALPMGKVSGLAFRQKVTFTTGFDAALVEKVTQTMTQGVAWLRAVAVELYELALSTKCVGDMAFNTGNGDMAFARWLDTFMFIKHSLERNEMIGARLEPNFLSPIYALQCVASLDKSMLMFSNMAAGEFRGEFRHECKGETKKVGNAEEAELCNKISGYEVVPASAIARFYRFLGVAELGEDHPVKAAKAFAKSYKIMSLPGTKDGYDIAKSWKELTKAEQKLSVVSLHTALPKRPHTMPELQVWKGPQVASEHWVMRELGFKGEIPYADKIIGVFGLYLAKEPHPNRSLPGPRTLRLGAVKPEVLRKAVEDARERVNIPGIPGIELVMKWIALGTNQIGEESIQDDPQTARMREEMSLLGNGGCSTQ